MKEAKQRVLGGRGRGFNRLDFENVGIIFAAL